ncbi:MAG: patatin-like phospholipase family protein [Desulfobacterales bacterium]
MERFICSPISWYFAIAEQYTFKIAHDSKSIVILEAQPTKKFVGLDEIGSLTLFLIGDFAASITGTAISIDGGLDSKMKKHGIFNDERNTDRSFSDSPQKYESNAQVINLALQGGGAHGAYAWGIIDRFLQDGRIRFEGICATSAGSMNAVVLAYGSMTGGPRGAQEALHHFWKKISEMGATYSPLRQTPFEFFNNRVNNKWNMDPLNSTVTTIWAWQPPMP